MLRLTRFRLLCCLGVLLGLTACNYNSRLPQKIYPVSDTTPKINARVLIPAEHIAQEKFVFKDYHLSSSVQSYSIDLRKGSLIAAADALGTLFTLVDVDKTNTSANYDYIARLTYNIVDPRENSLESVQWLNYSQMPQLQTQVTLTLSDSKTGEVVFTAYASRENRIELNNITAAAYHMQNNSLLSAIFLPLTSPIYTQQMGKRIKYTLSRDLRACLEEITQTLHEQSALFIKE